MRQGAGGTGVDWTNAYPSLPATLVRGATYHLAAGRYPGYLFDDAGVWDRGALEFGNDAPASPALSVTLNQPTFRPADVLVVTVRAVAGVVSAPVDV